MTSDEREEIKACIAFYDKRGWDWSEMVEYLVLKYNNSPFWPLRMRVLHFGRPRKRGRSGNGKQTDT